MLGVQRNTDGSWAWIAPCGASGAEHATSRDLTRESYAQHRAKCRTCSGAAGAPLPAAKDAAKSAPVTAELSAPPSRGGKPAKKTTKSVSLTSVSSESAKKASPSDKAAFTRAVKAGDTLEHAWAAVRKAFPRAEWGKVRDITQACSPYRSFAAAYKDLHK